VIAGRSTSVHDNDALGRRRAGANVMDENGEEFNLGEEELALAPVVGGAHAARDVATIGARLVIAEYSREVTIPNEFGRGKGVLRFLFSTSGP